MFSLMSTLIKKFIWAGERWSAAQISVGRRARLRFPAAGGGRCRGCCMGRPSRSSSCFGYYGHLRPDWCVPFPSSLALISLFIWDGDGDALLLRWCLQAGIVRLGAVIFGLWLLWWWSLHVGGFLMLVRPIGFWIAPSTFVVPHRLVRFWCLPAVMGCGFPLSVGLGCGGGGGFGGVVAWCGSGHFSF
uniref:Uncharacterized protein n=1 Tax=Aegilops tauschii subsp. strangulata TaxID=200361 RepID=A0A453DGC9_AEGTS